MTKEIAIHNLYALKLRTRALSNHEALDLAIKALEQQSCEDCPFCIFTAEEKKYIGYCNTSNEDYYCKALDKFMEYDEVDGGVDILGKPVDCPLQEESE